VSDLPSYPADAAEREAQPVQTGAQYASWGRRLVAYLLDALIVFALIAVALVVPIALAALFPEDGAGSVIAVALVALAFAAAVIGPFVYHTVLTGNARGQTWGKRALGVRVVGDGDGGPIGYGRAFGRYFITFVFGFFFFPMIVDYLWPLWDAKNQTIHDKLVGSVVVRI
jgi:uncharacterized RDD family membrane protein YckC